MTGVLTTGLLIEDPTLFGVEYWWRCADCKAETPHSFDRDLVLTNARLHRTDHHREASK